MITVADTARELVLVDGRSGAGKSDWVAQSERFSDWQIVSLDELYPGWDGLDAGHWLAYRDLILPWREGQVARVRLWEWLMNKPGGVREIHPETSLVIEGCGALSSLTAPHATDRYWLEADAGVRRDRALARDGEMFAPQWTRWALQEDRFYAQHRSWERADRIIRT